MRDRYRYSALAALAPAWMLALIVAAAIVSQRGTAALQGDPPPIWPRAVAITRALDRPTLLMLVDSRCSRSRASLDELDDIMARVGDAVDARVLFVETTGVADATADTDLWTRAEGIRGVTVARVDDALADRFGALASGATVIYGADGRLLFTGGVTGPSNDGDGLGRRAILSALDGSVGVRRAPVYGCALFGPDRGRDPIPAS